MRLFFAIRLPEEAREALRPAAAALGRSRVEQLHFTLAFLGETERADDACAAAGEVHAAPFEVSIAGAGAFPSPSRPRVLWLGVADGAQEMIALAGALGAALRARRFALEERPFRPHLTIERVKPGRDRSVRRAIESVPPGELARFHASEFCLMQSALGAGGARHSLVRAFPLC